MAVVLEVTVTLTEKEEMDFIGRRLDKKEKLIGMNDLQKLGEVVTGQAILEFMYLS